MKSTKFESFFFFFFFFPLFYALFCFILFLDSGKDPEILDLNEIYKNLSFLVFNLLLSTFNLFFPFLEFFCGLLMNEIFDIMILLFNHFNLQKSD